MKVLITGGAGFIGSALVRHILNSTDYKVLNVDCLTYAGNQESLKSIEKNDNYSFSHVDICNKNDLKRLFNNFKPNLVMHLAAESHVDRSIDGPLRFLETNIIGTFNLLDEARQFYQGIPSGERRKFKFHHISTDEVYGDLENDVDLFTEKHPTLQVLHTQQAKQVLTILLGHGVEHSIFQ